MHVCMRACPLLLTLLIRWDKELSREDDHVSDMKMPQAEAQADGISSTLETAQKRILQPDQVVSAPTLDQTTDVTISQMSSPEETQAIVHPQEAQEVVCQATALQTALMCPQLYQAVALQMPQVLTVQPGPMSAPSQSDVLAPVTTTQKNVCSVETAQGSAPPAVNVGCALETAQGTAALAIHAECTLETALASAPQTAQVCPFEVSQGTTFQTGQASSVVSVCKEDG